MSLHGRPSDRAGAVSVGGMSENPQVAPVRPAVRSAAELDAADARVRDLAREDGMGAWYAGLIDGMGWTRPGGRLRSPVRHEEMGGEPPDAGQIAAEIAACDDVLSGGPRPNEPLAWIRGVRAALRWVRGEHADLPVVPDPASPPASSP